MSKLQVNEYLYLLDRAFETSRWHALLDNLKSLTEEEWEWAPAPGGRTVKYMVWHVADSLVMYNDLAFGEVQRTWEEIYASAAPRLTTTAEGIAYLRESCSRFYEFVAALDDDDLPKPRRTNSVQPQQTRWTIAAMIEHMVYHAGEANHILALKRGTDGE